MRLVEGQIKLITRPEDLPLFAEFVLALSLLSFLAGNLVYLDLLLDARYCLEAVERSLQLTDLDMEEVELFLLV